VNESSFCAHVQYFTSQRRFSIRGISRVTRGYFLTLFAFYSLVSSVTYLQILTTNLLCGKFYKFELKKTTFVLKFRNKIFAFKKITHYRIFVNFHHSCRTSFLLIYEIKKIGHRHRFWDSGTFMGEIGRLYAVVMLPWEHWRYRNLVRNIPYIGDQYCHQVEKNSRSAQINLFYGIIA
jgi:hypothetical protein